MKENIRTYVNDEGVIPVNGGYFIPHPTGEDLIVLADGKVIALVERYFDMDIPQRDEIENEINAPIGALFVRGQYWGLH